MNDELKIKNNELGGKMNYRYRNDEEMKDSGVEWIGKIPKEWNITRVKYALRKKITDGPHETPQFISEGIPFLSVDAIQDGKLIFDNCRYISEEDHNRYIKKCKPEKNDVLMGKAASTGKIARIDKDIEFSIWSPLALLKPDTNIIKPKYLEYSMKSNQTQYEIELLCTNNTQKNISMDDIKIIMPDIKKQKKIVDFLQQKTAQFDSIISKKEALIEKLEEAKKSLISEVVTGKVRVVKTDDGYELVERTKEEMKDSGVEWLGKVPSNWSVTKLKHLVSTKITDGPHETPVLVDNGVPFLSAEAIVGDKVSISNMRGYITEEQYEIYAKKSRVFKGDILFCKSGSTTGKSALVKNDKKFGIWSPLAIIRANNKKINYNNLFYVIQSTYFRIQVENYWTFGTQPNIGMNTLENLYVPYSKNRDEQENIYKYLINKSREIEGLVYKTNVQIEKLKEAKQSLISEAVTGKIEILD